MVFRVGSNAPCPTQQTIERTTVALRDAPRSSRLMSECSTPVSLASLIMMAILPVCSKNGSLLTKSTTPGKRNELAFGRQVLGSPRWARHCLGGRIRQVRACTRRSGRGDTGMRVPKSHQCSGGSEWMHGRHGQ